MIDIPTATLILIRPFLRGKSRDVGRRGDPGPSPHSSQSREALHAFPARSVLRARPQRPPELGTVAATAMNDGSPRDEPQYRYLGTGAVNGYNSSKRSLFRRQVDRRTGVSTSCMPRTRLSGQVRSVRRTCVPACSARWPRSTSSSWQWTLAVSICLFSDRFVMASRRASAGRHVPCWLPRPRLVGRVRAGPGTP